MWRILVPMYDLIHIKYKKTCHVNETAKQKIMQLFFHIILHILLVFVLFTPLYMVTEVNIFNIPILFIKVIVFYFNQSGLRSRFEQSYFLWRLSIMFPNINNIRPIPHRKCEHQLYGLGAVMSNTIKTPIVNCADLRSR